MPQWAALTLEPVARAVLQPPFPKARAPRAWDRLSAPALESWGPAAPQELAISAAKGTEAGLYPHNPSPGWAHAAHGLAAETAGKEGPG